jgi:hypothetical protein
MRAANQRFAAAARFNRALNSNCGQGWLEGLKTGKTAGIAAASQIQPEAESIKTIENKENPRLPGDFVYFSISTPRQKAMCPLILRAEGLGSG